MSPLLAGYTGITASKNGYVIEDKIHTPPVKRQTLRHLEDLFQDHDSQHIDELICMSIPCQL